jgi:hypothetical protein
VAVVLRVEPLELVVLASVAMEPQTTRPLPLERQTPARVAAVEVTLVLPLTALAALVVLVWSSFVLHAP